MRRNSRIPYALACVLLVQLAAACAPRSTSTVERSRSDALVVDDLVDFGTVLDAVQALRPEWLRQRTGAYLANHAGGVTKPANPVWIYWDGTLLGDPSFLGRVTPSQVSSVRYYDARSASMRWGINHENGVIYLTPSVGGFDPGIR